MLKLIQTDIRIARAQGWTYRYIHTNIKRAVDNGVFVTWVDWVRITDADVLAKALRITERLASLEQGYGA